MRILVDTGPLVALLDGRDQYHSWCKEQAARLLPPFHTCEAVLAEAHFLLAHVHNGNLQLNKLLGTGKLAVSFSASGRLQRIETLMATYKDVPMSFADACLVAMMEEQGGTLLTVDSDFGIYRMKKNRALNLIRP